MFSAKFRFGYVGLLAAYSYLNIKFTEGDQLLAADWSEWILMMVILLTVILIWEGNRLIFKTLEGKSLPKSRPLVLLFLFSTFFVILISSISFFVQNALLDTYSWLPFKLTLGFSFRINLFLNCVNAIIFYQKRFASAEIQAEQFKKETALAQMDSLKRQVKPHFLFNSLNVLDSLIRSNPEEASVFAEKLSSVYRYFTNIELQELVYVKDELSFVEDYIFLMETRFKDNLKVKVDINEGHLNKRLPPFTLQLLLENAIKHNQISIKIPLDISITSEDNAIVTFNLKNLKKVNNSKNGVGLDNIKSRYLFLNKVIEIVEDEKSFSVKVPLID
ncbi:MAG: two-component system LytT family sensor kinase [Cyclobacteriaceae bacterium]|jgi:two-component system LytT family sensor kinase